jgi:hypothetical protein
MINIFHFAEYEYFFFLVGGDLFITLPVALQLHEASNMPSDSAGRVAVLHGGDVPGSDMAR